jgi:hypothetical protein
MSQKKEEYGKFIMQHNFVMIITADYLLPVIKDMVAVTVTL